VDVALTIVDRTPGVEAGAAGGQTPASFRATLRTRAATVPNCGPGRQSCARNHATARGTVSFWQARVAATIIPRPNDRCRGRTLAEGSPCPTVAAQEPIGAVRRSVLSDGDQDAMVDKPLTSTASDERAMSTVGAALHFDRP
jgi:hypothetical protein